MLFWLHHSLEYSGSAENYFGVFSFSRELFWSILVHQRIILEYFDAAENRRKVQRRVWSTVQKKYNTEQLRWWCIITCWCMSTLEYIGWHWRNILECIGIFWFSRELQKSTVKSLLVPLTRLWLFLCHWVCKYIACVVPLCSATGLSHCANASLVLCHWAVPLCKCIACATD